MPYSALTTAVSLPIDCYACRWDCRYPRVHCVKDVAPSMPLEAMRAAWDRPGDKPGDKPRLVLQTRAPWPAEDPTRPRVIDWPAGLLDPQAVEVVRFDPAGAAENVNA